MNLFVTAKTKEKDVTIDYLRFTTAEGKEIFVDWDSSDYIRDDGQIETRFKNVSFNNEYANGRIREVKDAKLSDWKIDYPDGSFSYMSLEKGDFEITKIEFVDGDYLLQVM